MKSIYITAILAIAGYANADEENTSLNSELSEEQTASSAAKRKLSFCILDFGPPHIYGGGPSFWIGSSGQVFTQQFESSDKGMQQVRFEYKLTPVEQSKLFKLLEVLRKDDRVLRERYLIPGEFSPHIAFSISPSSDLHIRQKHSNDEWMNFSAVTGYLWQLHQEKTKPLKPVFKGAYKMGDLRGGVLWEPEAFVKRETIDTLRYFWSDRHDAMLEKNSKSEKDGADQPTTAPKLKSDCKMKP